jgi:large subunit ribosomal protein L30
MSAKKEAKSEQHPAGAQLKITLVRSVLGYSEKQRRVVRALGLRHTNHEILQYDTPIIQGMLHKVRHLVKVEVA